jgi:hypothetical protein
MNMGFGEKLEVLANELYAFSVGAIDVHGILLDALLVAVVDFFNELVEEGPFSGAGRPVKNDMGDFLDLVKIVELLSDGLVYSEHWIQ